MVVIIQISKGEDNEQMINPITTTKNTKFKSMTNADPLDIPEVG